MIEVKTNSHDILTQNRFIMIDLILKEKKVNWAKFILQRMMEEVNTFKVVEGSFEGYETAQAKGYGLSVLYLLKQLRVKVGN